jgi:hypothetical protein
MGASSGDRYLQLLITLQGIEPPIWRRVVVSGTLTFEQLHEVIQRAMGWYGCHLHEFRVGPTRLGIPSDDDFFDDGDVVIESDTTLAEQLGKKRKFRYWYDFGDDWWHEIAVEKRLPANPDAAPAELIDGARACPPEDCGGPWGYARLLEVLADPQHPDHKEMSEWAGAIDPEAFDLGRTRHEVAQALSARAARH